MLLLFVAFVFSSFALLWAAVSIARHIRRHGAEGETGAHSESGFDNVAEAYETTKPPIKVGDTLDS